MLYFLGSLLGLSALLAPLLAPTSALGTPAVMTVAVLVTLLALLSEAQSRLASPQALALLAMLTALNASLRFIENAIPGPGGFSPVFFMIILGGYVFGARFGLLLGALTLVVSALMTGGVGPWLPYQMLLAGWVGLGTALLRPLRAGSARVEIAGLIFYGVVWGFLYGALANLWFWPLLAPPTPGLALTARLRQYGAFYLVTSLGWDAFRAAGNALFLLALGAPTLRVLRRFAGRLTFRFEVEEA